LNNPADDGGLFGAIIDSGNHAHHRASAVFRRGKWSGEAS